MNKRNSEKYQGYRIEVNWYPHPFEDRSVGFAWAFGIYSDAFNKPLSTVVFAAPMGLRTQENIDRALELGRSRVHSLIDDGGFERKHHCYLWKPDGPDPHPVTQVDCGEILPREALTPLA